MPSSLYFFLTKVLTFASPGRHGTCFAMSSDRFFTYQHVRLFPKGIDPLCNSFSERGEGVQDVLTLFCSGAAQLCHDDRVVELKEQLDVEEEDGDRQEVKAEEKRRNRVKECAMDGHADGSANALRT